MWRLGTVTRIAGGVLVVRADEDRIPEIGADTVDDQLRTVGPVVDVFGPIDRPYFAVSPADDTHLPELLGDPLYVRG
ncbi:MAG: H/ACA ribonucleoprotein complex subunit GAR1 [Halobacteriaceae archaeon]